MVSCIPWYVLFKSFEGPTANSWILAGSTPCDCKPGAYAPEPAVALQATPSRIATVTRHVLLALLICRAKAHDHNDHMYEKIACVQSIDLII